MNQLNPALGEVGKDSSSCFSNNNETGDDLNDDIKDYMDYNCKDFCGKTLDEFNFLFPQILFIWIYPC